MDKKKWKKYDTKRLIEACNALDIAENLGMDITHSGSTIYIPCVSGEHSESRYNHNQLFQNGCHCYSCGKTYNTIEMVMQYYQNIENTPISFSQACKLLSDVSGEECFQNSNEDDIKNFFPLTKEEIRLLLLSERNTGIGSIESIEQGSRKSGTCNYTSKNHWTLVRLFKEEPTLFQNLIERKCKEAIRFYEEKEKESLTLELLSDRYIYLAIEFRRKKEKVEKIQKKIKESL